MQFSRIKLPDVDGENETEKEPSIRNIFTIRNTDLEPVEWLEFAETINNAFEKLFNSDGYGELDEEDIQDAVDMLTSLIDDNEEDEDDEDEDEDE